MDYSNRISQHILALRHYLMAEAEIGKPFNSERERNSEIEELLNYPLFGLCMCGFVPKEIQEEYPGFAGLMKRIKPSFHIGLPIARMEKGFSSHSGPTVGIYIVEEKPRKDIYRIFIIPDSSDFLERAEKLARLRKTLEKYENADDCFSISFSAERKINAEAEKLVHELLTESTVYFPGSSIHTSDMSEKNVAALDRLLTTAVKTIYPKNVGYGDVDEAMVEVIRLCGSERMRIMLSDQQYFTSFFSAPPYCWSSEMIMLVQGYAQHEDILLPEEEPECDDDEEEEDEDE